ncbi:MAG: phage tail spike protein [Christensenellales bacterium]
MRYPRIYDLNLRRTGELRTAEITDLKLKDTPLSCVTVTVPTKDIGSFGYRQFVEIFDAAGKRIDLFRVTEIPKGVYGRAGTKKLKCDQVLCTLSDDITPTYMQIGGNGQPLASCIRQVLACQQTARWKLGRCDFATLYEYSFASEGLLSALLKLIEPIPDALMTTDTTGYPWTLNVVRADDTDATELRYSRNMEEISEEVLDTDFATRLYPLGYGEGVNQLNIKSVNGGTAYIDSPTQALWGVVSKPYVDTTITDAVTLLAQGRAALELCCNPHVSYGVACKDISILTGEPLDAFYTGRMARIIYRDYGLTIRARVREIHYPKPITEPWNAKLTIANRSADVASVIAQLQRTSRIEQLYGQGSTTFYSGGIEQNADKDTPAEGDIYIPDDMVHINAIMLKVTLSAFRADSKGAKGGGGTVTTTRASGGGTQTSEAGGGATLTVSARCPR